MCSDSGPDIQLACRKLASVHRRCILIDGDAPDMLRHYFAEPPRKDSDWQAFRYELLDKKMAFLKSVTYSTRLAQKFWATQVEFLENHGGVGGYCDGVQC